MLVARPADNFILDSWVSFSLCIFTLCRRSPSSLPSSPHPLVNLVLPDRTTLALIFFPRIRPPFVKKRRSEAILPKLNLLRTRSPASRALSILWSILEYLSRWRTQCTFSQFAQRSIILNPPSRVRREASRGHVKHGKSRFSCRLTNEREFCARRSRRTNEKSLSPSLPSRLNPARDDSA